MKAIHFIIVQDFVRIQQARGKISKPQMELLAHLWPDL